jgi:hypothetical protein
MNAVQLTLPIVEHVRWDLTSMIGEWRLADYMRLHVRVLLAVHQGRPRKALDIMQRKLGLLGGVELPEPAARVSTDERAPELDALGHVASWLVPEEVRVRPIDVHPRAKTWLVQANLATPLLTAGRWRVRRSIQTSFAGLNQRETEFLQDWERWNRNMTNAIAASLVGVIK